MGKVTGVEWCHHTFNFWWGCTKVSEECKFCYAAELDNRYYKDDPHWGDAADRRFFSDEYWKQPRRWNRAAEKAGERRRVFSSMMDFFEDRADLVDVRERAWALIAATPWLDWLLLTKRPENIQRMLPSRPYITTNGYTSPWSIHAWPNVWLGTTCGNQERANERLPHLLAVTPRPPVFFCSYEPALGPVDFHRIEAPDGMHASALTQQRDSNLYELPAALDWIIAGCESGHHARPADVRWFTDVRDQCAEVGKAYYFKQAVGSDLVTLGKGSKTKGRAGKAAVLSLPYLDGRQHAEVPL